MLNRFHDRHDAGRWLAGRLAGYANRSDTQVLALPRGGVPVAYEVARTLNAPLDVFLVRKLGVPGYDELAMGTLAMGGVRILNEQVVRGLGIPDDVIEAIARWEGQELAFQEQLYRARRPPLELRGRTTIVVDDGLATGATMQAAVTALRTLQPARIVAAVPVASAEGCLALRAAVDEVVCVMTPEPFDGVGVCYKEFSPTSDDEVRALLARPTRVESAA
jgi:predicted phosphoribosyltransferase